MYQEITRLQYRRAMNLGPRLRNKVDAQGAESLKKSELHVLNTYLGLLGKDPVAEVES